ncbi:MAG: hypothetical protein ACK2UA_02065, partial [Anaerolineae bacterium]
NYLVRERRDSNPQVEYKPVWRQSPDRFFFPVETEQTYYPAPTQFQPSRQIPSAIPTKAIGSEMPFCALIEQKDKGVFHLS